MPKHLHIGNLKVYDICLRKSDFDFLKKYSHISERNSQIWTTAQHNPHQFHPSHHQPQQPHFEAAGGTAGRPQLRHKLSYGDLLSNKRQAPVMLQKNKARARRSRSEFRPQIIG